MFIVFVLFLLISSPNLGAVVVTSDAPLAFGFGCVNEESTTHHLPVICHRLPTRVIFVMAQSIELY